MESGENRFLQVSVSGNPTLFELTYFYAHEESIFFPFTLPFIHINIHLRGSQGFDISVLIFKTLYQIAMLEAKNEGSGYGRLHNV